MNRIYSNGPTGDFVLNPFTRLMAGSSQLHLAAPFFTEADPLHQAAKEGKSIQLIIGLNAATSPQALAKIHNVPNLAIRFLTHRFHAKIYLFDNAALIGSSNLTDGGLKANREATICLDEDDDTDAIEELRALFLDLWESAHVLTSETLETFTAAHKGLSQTGPSPDEIIEDAVGRAEPANINVDSKKKAPERLFLEQLRREVYEQYRPAFQEVTDILTAGDIHRPELAGIGAENETNRFLNWVRLTHVVGDEAWQTAPLRPEAERRLEIERLGKAWGETPHPRIPDDYVDWLQTVARIFGTEDVLAAASKDDLTDGLRSLHAFTEQLRFVKGGAENLPPVFWDANNNDTARVKSNLTYLLYGSGDFIQRLHDVLYAPERKIGRFGRFCALELYGTVKPAEYPPMNGRMAKALRYLGFDVRGS